MTKLQSRSYATVDAEYAAVSGADYENTLAVRDHHRPQPGEAVVDAGLKAVRTEFGDPTVLVEGATSFETSRGARRESRSAARRRSFVAAGDRAVAQHGSRQVNLRNFVST